MIIMVIIIIIMLSPFRGSLFKDGVSDDQLWSYHSGNSLVLVRGVVLIVIIIIFTMIVIVIIVTMMIYMLEVKIYLKDMKMRVNGDSDKGRDEVLVWSPGVGKPQLCFKVVNEI